jgi:predicted acylesterase/phospholipase RssA
MIAAHKRNLFVQGVMENQNVKGTGSAWPALESAGVDILKDGNCYADGGITNNYPIYQCLDNDANPDEIFGITLPKENNKQTITEQSSLFDYLSFILNRMYKHAYLASIKDREYKIRYELLLENAIESMYDFRNVSSSKEQRSLLLNKGVELWNVFMEKHIVEG